MKIKEHKSKEKKLVIPPDNPSGSIIFEYAMVPMALCMTIFILQLACASEVVETLRREPISGRPYTLLSSSSWDAHTKRPLLVALHAYQTPPEVLLNRFSLQKNAVSKRGWFLVVPKGKRDDRGHLFWNASPGCCSSHSSKKPDDLTYLNNVVAQVKRSYPIDPERLYVIGESNGAFMAHRLACDLKSGVRAIVAISGVGPSLSMASCVPSRSVNVFQIHGDADDIIRYNGKTDEPNPYPSVTKTVEGWVELNRIEAKPQIDTIGFFLSNIQRHRWKNGSKEVRLWRVINGGHNIRWLRFRSQVVLDFLGKE